MTDETVDRYAAMIFYHLNPRAGGAPPWARVEERVKRRLRDAVREVFRQAARDGREDRGGAS